MLGKKTAPSKGYTKIDFDLGAPDTIKKSVKTEMLKQLVDNTVAKSKLPSMVQDFIKFIFDKELMEKSVSMVGYDVKKLPLGQLSEQTVKDGYAYLRQIESILAQIKKGKCSLSS